MMDILIVTATVFLIHYCRKGGVISDWRNYIITKKLLDLNNYSI